jgi:hypothetical protein
MKRLAQKLAVPGALVFGACTPSPSLTDAGSDAGRDAGADAGYDAGMPDAGDLGPCPNSSPGTPMPASSVDDAGVRCECEPFFQIDGGFGECCDEDIGNPCGICCYNPKDADAGREYYLDDGGYVYSHDTDAGQPVCFC